MESPYNNDIYTLRTLFLLEDSPNSGKYVEVMMTHEVANKLRDIVAKEYPCPCKPDCKDFKLACEDFDGNLIDAPKAMGEYSKEEIQKALLDF